MNCCKLDGVFLKGSCDQKILKMSFCNLHACNSLNYIVEFRLYFFLFFKIIEAICKSSEPIRRLFVPTYNALMLNSSMSIKM